MNVYPFILAAALALVPGISSAEVNASLAGQTVVNETADGQHRKEYAPNGQLIYEVLEKQGSTGMEATEREWSQDGTPLREQTFLNGDQMQATFWYMNGQVREKHTNQALRDPKGPPGNYIEYFSDVGLPQASGVVQGRFKRVGLHRFYDEQGKLKAEVVYDASGTKISEKTFNASGAAGEAQEFYPDGSRRLR